MGSWKHAKTSVCYHQRHWTSTFPTSSSISRGSFVPFRLSLLGFPPKSCCGFSTWPKRAEQPSHIGAAGTKNPLSRIIPKLGAAGIHPGELPTSSSEGFPVLGCSPVLQSWMCPQWDGLDQDPTGMGLSRHSGELFPSPRNGNIRGGDDKEVTQGVALSLQHQYPHPAPGAKTPTRAWKPNQKSRK